MAAALEGHYHVWLLAIKGLPETVIIFDYLCRRLDQGACFASPRWACMPQQIDHSAGSVAELGSSVHSAAAPEH
jgi:hypothetical protein